MTYPRVSVIILNWNGWEDTKECLESLAKITYPNFETIIVDNASTDGSRKYLRDLEIWKFRDLDKNQNKKKRKSSSKFLNLYKATPTSSRRSDLNYHQANNSERSISLKVIFNKKNLGFAGGNNVAIRQVLKEGKSDFILLLNNDTVVEKNFLNELIKAARNKEKAGILGPKIYYYNYRGKKNVIQSAGSVVNLYLGKFPSIEKLDEVDSRSVDVDKVKGVDSVIGACLLIKTKVVREVGFLDKSYFLLFEDTDWCLRVKKVGYSVLYVPRSIIWHKKGQSVKKVSEVYYYTRNLFWLEFKHANCFQLLCFLLNYFILVFPKYFLGYLLVKRDYGLWKNYVRGVIAGVGFKLTRIDLNVKNILPGLKVRKSWTVRGR
jgi:hypothetical protein